MRDERTGNRTPRSREAGRRNSGDEGEADAARARVSGLPEYATTGVKTQAFVLVLFLATEIEAGIQLLMNKRSRYRTREAGPDLSDSHIMMTVSRVVAYAKSPRSKICGHRLNEVISSLTLGNLAA
jgi:hypothetical protein